VGTILRLLTVRTVAVAAAVAELRRHALRNMTLLSTDEGDTDETSAQVIR
jgi:hypothetical protein